MKVTITRDAYEKLWQFIKQCDEEISGFGKVREITSAVEGQNILEIYDIETFKQSVSGTHATIDEEALAEFITEKVMNDEDIADYKVWWHSHVNMDAFFSSVDTGTIDISREFPYLISIVGNKRQEFKVRVDVYKPLRFTQENLKLELAENPEIIDWVGQEILEKITFSRATSIPTFPKTATTATEVEYEPERAEQNTKNWIDYDEDDEDVYVSEHRKVGKAWGV